MFSSCATIPKLCDWRLQQKPLPVGRLAGWALQEIEEKVALKKIEGVFEHITIAKA